jgi:hypothetical protein
MGFSLTFTREKKKGNQGKKGKGESERVFFNNNNNNIALFFQSFGFF